MNRLKTAQTAIENAGKVLEDLGGSTLSPLARTQLSAQAKGDLTIAQVQLEDFLEENMVGSEPEETEVDESTEEEEENDEED